MPEQVVKRAQAQYLTRDTSLAKSKELYAYFWDLAHKTNNLYNRVLYIQRNSQSAAYKSANGITLSDHEKEVVALIKTNGIKTSPSGYVGKFQMINLLIATKDPDFYALPSGVSDQTVFQVDRSYKAFFAAIKDYEAYPEKYKGRPRKPGYLEKCGVNIIIITSPKCRFKLNKRGNYQLAFPKTKLTLPVGKSCPPGRLKEVQVSFSNGSFKIIMITDDMVEASENTKTGRVMGIDPGEVCLMAVVNNYKAPCMLFDGEELREHNREHNDKIDTLTSRQTAFRHIDAPINSRGYSKLLQSASNFQKDYLHKCAKRLFEKALADGVETIVFGHNKGQKQHSNMGKKNNREFQQIRYTELINTLDYLCREHGMKFVVVEESYTSKASFLDGDEIPEHYDGEQHHFSGKRTKRGIYRASDGTEIHADLNAAANILRKVIPDAFVAGEAPDFNNVIKITDPDKRV